MRLAWLVRRERGSPAAGGLSEPDQPVRGGPD